MRVTQTLMEQGVITAPDFLRTNTMYECYTGSTAYGMSTLSSDLDVYGFAIPPKEYLFPHLSGCIAGYDTPQTFDQYIKHGVAYKDKEYDVTIFNITKYFFLCAKCNPNMIDTLFIPRELICCSTAISEMVREKRHLFLSKMAYPAFKGYAFSQMNKIRTKTPTPDSKRYEQYQRLGFDTKYASHLIRLLDEAEQIFTTGDLDLQRNKEELKAIRRGDFTLSGIEKLAKFREERLEKAFAESKIRQEPDRPAIKQLLIDCLEHHYGKLGNILHVPGEAERKLEMIRNIL